MNLNNLDRDFLINKIIEELYNYIDAKLNDNNKYIIINHKKNLKNIVRNNIKTTINDINDKNKEKFINNYINNISEKIIDKIKSHINIIIEYLNDIKTNIINIEGIKNKKTYSIFRISIGEKSEFDKLIIKHVFKKFEFKDIYENENDSSNLNNWEILKKEPEKSTILFIKEKLRCADTINKEFIAILHERKAKEEKDNTLGQSLVGRACGYIDTNNIIIYTSLKAVNNIIKFWKAVKNNNSDIDEYRANNLQIKDGNLTNKKTTINENLNNNSNNNNNNNINKFKIKKFIDTDGYVLKKANKWIKEHFGERKGEEKKTPDKDGFYKHKKDKQKIIHEFNKVIKNKEYINNNNDYNRLYCYKDKTNSKTLCIIIYYNSEKTKKLKIKNKN